MKCPTCDQPTRGQCRQPDCLREANRADAVLDQWCEVDE